MTTDRPHIGEIDSTIAHEARVYDYLLGGTENFPVDRAAALASAEAFGGLDRSRAVVRANRLFLGRAVDWLIDAGIRQFLDIGTGIPTANNVHQVAQSLAPEARVVYVDNDPLVLAHAQRLLTSTPEGATAYVEGDLRDPDYILGQAAATLDFTRPVAVMLISMLHFQPDHADPYSTVARYLDAVPPGSYLAITHMAKDIEPEAIAALADHVANNDTVAYNFYPRTQTEVARFLTGLEPVEPGVVPIDHWHPHGLTPATSGDPTPAVFHGGIGHKP